MFNFVPLDEQYDGGFGVTADAFLEAAKSVSAAPAFLNQHLPVGFLLRHAVELYLKSVILVMHRRFALSWSDPSKSAPTITVEGKIQSLFSVHRIGHLYSYVEALFQSSEPQLSACSQTDWEGAFLPEITALVAEVDAADRKGTLLRYPLSGDKQRDSEKSAMKRVDVSDLANSFGRPEEGPPVKAMITVDSSDNIVAVYGLDRTVHSSLGKALEQLAEHLSTLHFAVRMDLARGS